MWIELKVLHLPHRCQRWQLKTLLRQVLMLPAARVPHVRLWVARVQVPPVWLSGGRAGTELLLKM